MQTLHLVSIGLSVGYYLAALAVADLVPSMPTFNSASSRYLARIVPLVHADSATSQVRLAEMSFQYPWNLYFQRSSGKARESWMPSLDLVHKRFNAQNPPSIFGLLHIGPKTEGQWLET